MRVSHQDKDVQPLINRNFLLVLLSATLFAIPVPLLILLGGLAGLQLAPNDNLATLPFSLQLLAGLFTVAPMSFLMGRFGRKRGFLTASIFAVLGGLLAAFGVMYNAFWLLCAGHVLLGVALVTFQLFRFAAAELVAPAQQPKAISYTLGSGLIAALLAPEVFRVSRGFVEPAILIGPYLAVSALALLGALPLMLTHFAVTPDTPQNSALSQPAVKLRDRPKLIWAMICGASSAAGMVLLMTPTPLAMVGCGFSDLQAGDAIRWHVIAMFAPSFVTGSIIARIGANRVIIIGAVLLIFSGLVAINDVQLINFYVSLILLGIGWNFGFIGATVLLNSKLKDHEKALYQGFNDTVIALGSTGAAFASGVLIGALSWGWVAIVLIILACVTGLSSLLHSRFSAKARQFL